MHDRTKALVELFAAIISPEDPALSPDGQTIAFALSINSHSQIFTLSTADPGYPRRVTATLDDCIDPQWSPDGTRLVYQRGTALWSANADGTDARLLTDHPAGNEDARWSPDGTRLAFFSRRRGWEHVWTIGADGEGLQQVTHGAFDADDLVWSPGRSMLAFCSVHDDDLTTRGIYLVPAEGGQDILISPRGAWSGAPHFSPDGKHLAYLSDLDGWFHIYIYDLQNETTCQLTSGEFEDGGPYFYAVDRRAGPLFSPDGKQVAVIRHREGNFDVWVIGVEDGCSRRVSRDDGHYRLVGWQSDQAHLVVSYDNTARPPDLRLLSVDGSMRDLTDSRVGLERTDAMVLPEWITFPARDGWTIHAGLLRPPDRRERPPAVLFLHGGPNFQYADFYYPLPELLAQAGYLVLAPNFRGSTGYGRAFREANFQEWGNADALDVIDAARWLKTQAYVDPDRIAVIGPSYGGYLTLSALTLAPELFCAGIDLYGDSEIAESYWHGDRYGRMDLRRNMGTPEQNPEGYRRGSPYYLADRIQAPLLILHGREDHLVVPLMSEKIVEALRIENKYYESHFYENEGHGFSRPENKQDAWARVLRFLDQHCAGLASPNAGE